MRTQMQPMKVYEIIFWVLWARVGKAFSEPPSSVGGSAVEPLESCISNASTLAMTFQRVDLLNSCWGGGRDCLRNETLL